MSRDTELLLVALKNHGKIEGRKRFQKLVFLLQKQYNANIQYKFVPHLFGPYSRALQTDIDMLSFLGLVHVLPTIPYVHLLTKKGLQKARELERKMDPSELERINCALGEMRTIPTETLTKKAKSLM